MMKYSYSQPRIVGAGPMPVHFICGHPFLLAHGELVGTKCQEARAQRWSLLSFPSLQSQNPNRARPLLYPTQQIPAQEFGPPAIQFFRDCLAVLGHGRSLLSGLFHCGSQVSFQKSSFIYCAIDILFAGVVSKVVPTWWQTHVLECHWRILNALVTT